MNNKKFYITTPLYYPSGNWHLGHCYTTVCCDSISRFKRLAGFDTFFLTGTDEHGQKIADSAAKAGFTPKEYVDGLVDNIKKLWQRLDILYDRFIRTTDDYHVKSVQKIFTTLYQKGDIYKSSYKGKYCSPCEAFWTPSQLKDGKCPDCGRDVNDAEEDCYFFRLSKYSDKVEELLLKGDFLQPASRAKEMINNFIKPGLNDLAVSRSSVSWGIPVEFDKGQTVYVWIDALSNYINALGYNFNGENMDFWPADIHMVGKEIVRFHAIIWPAILMALGLKPPKKVYGHGWLLLSGDKMSKSKGNVADPFMLSDKFGTDAVRYYLLREIPFGQDGVFSYENFITRINSDLTNDLGNLVKRTVAMANQYFGGKVSCTCNVNCKDGHCTEREINSYTPQTDNLINSINSVYDKVNKAIDELSCSKALEEIFLLIGTANKYIDTTAPWILNKEGKTNELKGVLYRLLEALRVCATLLLPFIPDGAKRIFNMLNLPCPNSFSNLSFGAKKEYCTNSDQILFARIDLAKEMAEINALTDCACKEEKIKENKVEAKVSENLDNKTSSTNQITIDQFFNTQLCVVNIIAAEKVEKADKLLKLLVKCGQEERVVVSGIAKHYSPESLVGKQAVMVKNLVPVKLRGIMSHGMLLCATDGDKVVLVSPSEVVASGSEVS